jgi:hypothetical protein
MNNYKIIFLAGLHRSGTSLIHEILRSHPKVSGFSNTSVPEDEGQHLQTVYQPAKDFGGPGIFGFDERAYMNESHHLATSDNGERLFQQWSRYWNLKKEYLLEKSPPNIIRTRFLQKLFPKSAFVVILRHPIAVAYATKKWTKTSAPNLIEHNLKCYERFITDRPNLKSVYIMHYESFVRSPQVEISKILRWIGVEPCPINVKVNQNVNDKYFRLWERDLKSIIKRHFLGYGNIRNEFETRLNAFGYSSVNVRVQTKIVWKNESKAVFG